MAQGKAFGVVTAAAIMHKSTDGLALISGLCETKILDMTDVMCPGKGFGRRR